MIKFHNKHLVCKTGLQYMESLTEFCVNKFFTKKKAEQLFIEIDFVKNLFDDSCQYANCIWEDQHYRPNDFTIQIEPKQKIPMLLNSLAHELVHVKQWAKGEFFELQRERQVYKFNGKKFDISKIDYWDLPWEIEAHGRAIGLVVLWARENKLVHKNLVVDG